MDGNPISYVDPPGLTKWHDRGIIRTLMPGDMGITNDPFGIKLEEQLSKRLRLCEGVVYTRD